MHATCSNQKVNSMCTDVCKQHWLNRWKLISRWHATSADNVLEISTFKLFIVLRIMCSGYFYVSRAYTPYNIENIHIYANRTLTICNLIIWYMFLCYKFMLFHMELSDLEYLLLGKSRFFSWHDNMLIRSCNHSKNRIYDWSRLLDFQQ